MGYLSQRKKNERETLFLQIAAVVLGIWSLAVFLPAVPDFLQKALFHLYVANLGIMLAALFMRRFGSAAFFALLLILNYFHLSASANIFFDTKVKPSHHLAFSYQPDQPLEVSSPNGEISGRRRLLLAGGAEVPVVTIHEGNYAFDVMRVDFCKLKKAKQRRAALRQLKAFIATRDNPLIIFGNFGEPAWADNMKEFLIDTDLQVKNRLLMTQRGHRFDLFSAPSFYILAFPNVGIDDLNADFPKGKAYPRINAELGFF